MASPSMQWKYVIQGREKGLFIEARRSTLHKFTVLKELTSQADYHGLREITVDKIDINLLWNLLQIQRDFDQIDENFADACYFARRKGIELSISEEEQTAKYKEEYEKICSLGNDSLKNLRNRWEKKLPQDIEGLIGLLVTAMELKGDRTRKFITSIILDVYSTCIGFEQLDGEEEDFITKHIRDYYAAHPYLNERHTKRKRYNKYEDEKGMDEDQTDDEEEEEVQEIKIEEENNDNIGWNDIKSYNMQFNNLSFLKHPKLHDTRDTALDVEAQTQMMMEGDEI